ncbi:MAG: hypothetical protein Rhims3KO_05860 [Hyphomicrobiales bacterium]
MQRLIVLGLTLIIVTACARRLGVIAPAYIPFEAYMTQSYDELASLQFAKQHIPSVLEAHKTERLPSDAFGVFLV